MPTALMERLVADGYEVLLETGGHMPLDDVPDEVVGDRRREMSGQRRVRTRCTGRISTSSRRRDEVKFVIQDRADFDYACDVVVERRRSRARPAPCCSRRCTACSRRTELARWILERRVPARLQLQAHKYIWSPEARGV